MKKFAFTTFLAVIFITVSGCDKNEENAYILSTTFLKEKSWSGKYTHTNYGSEVTFLFIDDEIGYFIVNDDGPEEHHFKYYIRDGARILRISTVGTIQFEGDWMVNEIKKDYLLLKQGNAGDYPGKSIELWRKLP